MRLQEGDPPFKTEPPPRGCTMTADTSPTGPPSPSPSTPAAVTPVVASSPSASRRIGTRWLVWCAVAGVAAVLIYFGFQWWSFRSSSSMTDDAFVEAYIVNVAPEMVSGRLVSFLVNENDYVKEGQVLA